MPDISVIVTSFNKGEYICKSLTSILDNSFKNIELIIVEDQSTDESKIVIGNIIEKYNGRSIRLIENPINLGAGMSRRIGIEKASGKWISCIDADDWIEPDYFENLINASLKSNADIIYARIKYCCGDAIQNDTLCCGKEIITEDTRQIFDNFSWYGLQYLSYCLVKKELYERIGGYCPARFIEDTPTAVKILSIAKKIHIIPYYGYIYRKVEDSLINSHNIAETVYWFYYNLIDSMEYIRKTNESLVLHVLEKIRNDIYTICSASRIDGTDLSAINESGWARIVSYYSIDESQCKRKKEYALKNMSTVKILKKGGV